MKTAIKIFLFTIVVSFFYGYVGQMVPQKVTYPPEEAVLTADMTVDEMVAVGQTIVGGQGTCLTCHTMGSHSESLRFPDLGSIGAVAGTRKPGLDAATYLAESLYDPNTFVVDGFLPGMPVIHKPPISLNDQEILTVIAYLQTLGGEPTVTMDTKFEWQGQSTPAPVAAAPGAPRQMLSGEDVFNSYLCGTCHSLDSPAPMAGPSLYDIGSRFSRAEIYESILDPDATVADGYVAGVMSATLGGLKFTEKVTAEELKGLVDFLESKTGS